MIKGCKEHWTLLLLCPCFPSAPLPPPAALTGVVMLQLCETPWVNKGSCQSVLHSSWKSFPWFGTDLWARRGVGQCCAVRPGRVMLINAPAGDQAHAATVAFLSAFHAPYCPRCQHLRMMQKPVGNQY
ncbi:hypothetical protein AAFF_G00081710 [Aldrovandia affinis]|uniref:Secreted protein n=1 Tax=Aldrovandia affinis TaxID=143900 RepID=A0AAD7T3A8_9TELE|nr:hypothetical protein AAFF_G00081710 [Aldrovandia affinis]